MSNPVFKYKLLLCGPAAVGKTSLINRFVQNSYAHTYKLTVGVDILTKEVEFEPGNIATLSMWDIGGQERFGFIRTTFYKGAKGALLVFDLSREPTWHKIQQWLEEVRQFAGDIPFILVGNKVDLIEEVGEVIDRDECRRFAEENNSIYIETSAKTGENVEMAFLELTRRVYKAATGG